MSTCTPTLAAVVPSAPHSQKVRPSRTVAALRQGPSLRKLLGSAGELWTQLQARARRANGPFTVTARELSKQRPVRPLRTVEWGLQRLSEAGIIHKRRTRYGVVITLAGWDIDDNGMREYSPHLPAETLTWMRAQRARGRPKQPRPLPPPSEISPVSVQARPLTPENLFMHESVVEGLHEAPSTRARILAHPLVPPSPFTPALSLPRTPVPMMLCKDARMSEQREFLIEAYVSVSRAFYPRLAVQSSVKFMRSVDGRRLLDAAALVFMQDGIAPQAWLVLAFEREAARKRKNPLRPEIVYEPTLIHKGADNYHAKSDGHRMFLREPVRDERHAVYIKGMRDLCGLWQQTVLELNALDRYDEREIERICTRYWPKGYEAVYRNAELKMRSIQNELEARVVRGEYIWGA